MAPSRCAIKRISGCEHRDRTRHEEFVVPAECGDARRSRRNPTSSRSSRPIHKGAARGGRTAGGERGLTGLEARGRLRDTRLHARPLAVTAGARLDARLRLPPHRCLAVTESRGAPRTPRRRWHLAVVETGMERRHTRLLGRVEGVMAGVSTGGRPALAGLTAGTECRHRGRLTEPLVGSAGRRTVRCLGGRHRHRHKENAGRHKCPHGLHAASFLVAPRDEGVRTISNPRAARTAWPRADEPAWARQHRASRGPPVIARPPRPACACSAPSTGGRPPRSRGVAPQHSSRRQPRRHRTRPRQVEA